MKKTIITILLLTVVSLLRAGDLEVCGNSISSTGYINDSAIKSGTVYYDASTNTLTLTNVNIYCNSSRCIYNRNKPLLTVEFVGECVLSSPTAVIRCDQNTTFEGDGANMVDLIGRGSDSEALYIQNNKIIVFRNFGSRLSDNYYNNLRFISSTDHAIEGNSSCTLIFQKSYVWMEVHNSSKSTIADIGKLRLEACKRVVVENQAEESATMTDIGEITCTGGTYLDNPMDGVLDNGTLCAYGHAWKKQVTFLQGIPINSTNFPDGKFRDFVSTNYDKVNKDGYLEKKEWYDVYSMDVSSKSISNLKGIEYIERLMTLNCSDNSLISLDVSALEMLKTLDCSNNQLKSLDVSTCSRLEELICSYNKLESIDVSKCPELFKLYCNSNLLKTLNMSGCPQMSLLLCSKNQLTSLDVSMCSELIQFICFENNLQSINISGCPLNRFWCYGNNLDVAAMTDIVNKLYDQRSNTSVCEFAPYASYSYEKNICSKVHVNNAKAKNWAVWYWVNGQFQDYEGAGVLINTTNFPDTRFRSYVLNNFDTYKDECLLVNEANAVTVINVSGKGISNLKGVEHFPLLKELYCYNNDLTSLDLNGNPYLEVLYCGDNNLTSLILTSNLKLKKLYCYSNKLKNLNVTGLQDLQILSCFQNQLNTIYLTGCRSLDNLVCSGNQITSSYMNDIIYALPDRTGQSTGMLRIIQDVNDIDNMTNECSEQQAAAALAKNWKVCDWFDNPYPPVFPTTIDIVTEQAVPSVPCYNLQGQRVSSDYKGIVIINGKKVRK